MNSEILKKIKQKIQTHKELYSLFIDSKEIELFNDCISNIKRDGISSEESSLLKDIYESLSSMFTNIASDWYVNKGSLKSKEINIHYQNLESVLKMVTIIKGLKTGLSQTYVIPDIDEPTFIRDVESLQKKMKEALEKTQQQQSAAKQEELEKKAKEEFGKYIENGTIDSMSIKRDSNLDLLYTIIKLKEDNKSTDIKVSEFLNSDFCKKNKIVGFRISNGNQKEFISGEIYEGIRYYYIGTTVQYGIKFNWYVDGKECSITLGANSDGSIRIISDRPTDADLEKNKDVKIKVGNAYLSLADAVKTCRQQEDPSSTVKQASANEHCRPLARTSA